MRRFGIGCVLAAMAAPAGAGMPLAVEMKCPIGGKTFTHMSSASYSRWGTRPDGKPYGSWEFPIAIPVCPDNGLAVYKDFSKEELAKLKPLVRSPGYQAMRGRDTPYYAAYWLMTRLGDADEDRLWALLQASWEADGRPELKRRYQEEYAAGAAAMPAKPGELDWLALQGRAANALRELGRFDEAAALLAKLPTASLDVPVPEQKYGEATPSGLGRQVLNYGEVQEAKKRRGWMSYFKDIGTLIARRDASSEPIDMIPEREAIELCAGAGARLDDAARAWCEREDVRGRVEQLKKSRGG